MHELSICQALLEQVERIARAQHARRVLSVTVRVGPLAGVEPQLLASAYPLAVTGSLASGSELIVQRVPLRVRCLECGAESDASATRLFCGVCGLERVEMVSGDELLLASLDLEKQEN